MRMKCVDCNHKFVQPRIPAIVCPRCGGDYLVKATGAADHEDGGETGRLLTEVPTGKDDLNG